MLRTVLMLVAAAVSLASCASYFSATSLEPDGSGGYRFKAPATSFEWPVDDPHWEAQRRSSLDRRMAMNGFCPNGYRVTNRQAVLAARAILGDVWDVTYSIRCT